MKIVLLTTGSLLVVLAVLVTQERGANALENTQVSPGIITVPQGDSSPDIALSHQPHRVPERILIGTTTTSRTDDTAMLTLNVETKFVKKMKDTSAGADPTRGESEPQIEQEIERVEPAPTDMPIEQPGPKEISEGISTPTPTPIIEQELSSLTWGVFTGSNPNIIADFEERVGANPDYLAYFIHWPNDKGQIRPWLKTVAGDKGRTLVIFWEASDFTKGGTDQPAYSYKRILAGDHDAYIKDFARQVRDYDDPIILIPFSELNGNWTPWSGTKNGNTPAEAVLAYRYIHGFFENVSNVKFGLALNAASVPHTPENAHTAYYPGDEYVDYIGLDGFNMGDPWHSFNEIFAPGLKIISEYGKPIFIFSFGSAEGEGKAAWLKDAFYQMEQYPLMKGFIYFNQNKERNWLLWSDEDTFTVFEDFVNKL